MMNKNNSNTNNSNNNNNNNRAMVRSQHSGRNIPSESYDDDKHRSSRRFNDIVEFVEFFG